MAAQKKGRFFATTELGLGGCIATAVESAGYGVQSFLTMFDHDCVVWSCSFMKHAVASGICTLALSNSVPIEARAEAQV